MLKRITVFHLTRLGLSRRESEALVWVTRGKANAEVGAALNSALEPFRNIWSGSSASWESEPA
jgi:hypothetical protein